jgi:CubicO group peptidase (beta-lactamase class C family)
MKKISRFISFSILFPGLGLLCIPVAKAQNFKRVELPALIIHQIDSLVAEHENTFHYPGIAVAIASKGHQLWTKGYGYADLEQHRQVNPDEDLFRIGSISKTVTACALVKLIKSKKIDLDRPIGSYYSDIPADKAGLTLRQLGGHLAGIRHYNGFEFFNQKHYSNCIDPLEVFIHDSLLYVPGTQYQYSTYGFTVISAVMEKAIQVPFPEIVGREVTMPLHLMDLKTDQVDSLQYRRVSFYDFRDSALIVAPMVDNSNKWAGGGFLCSGDDLARFGYSLTSPGYLKKSSLKLLTTSQSTPDGKTTDYGLGIRTDTDKKGRAWIGHSGGSIGGTSMMLVYPEEDLVIVTLINLTSANMDDLAFKIADIVLADGKDH